MKATTSMICVCIALGFAGCAEEEPPEKFKPTRASREILSFPFEETLVDSRGREIRAVVVGRTRDEVIFQRVGESKRYRHPLAELSQENRDYIRRLPKGEWRPVSEFVKSLQEDMRRIDEKIADIKSEIDKTPFAQTRIRALNRELAKLEMDRQQIERDIAKRQKEEFGN